MYKLIGAKHKQGDFIDAANNKVQYDYISLYFVSDEGEVDFGQVAGVVKAKPDQLKIEGAKNLAEAVGREVVLVPDLTNPKYIRRVMVL